MASSKQDQDIVIQITRDFKGVNISELKIRKLTKTLCERFASRKPAGTKHEISIVIVGDEEIKRFNRNFLNRNAVTDCLSFDLSDDEEGPKVFELIVNGEMAVRQAKQRGHSSEAELALYITHGLLHNLGFDDMTTDNARKMHETEDEILREFGYGPVYNKPARPKEH